MQQLGLRLGALLQPGDLVSLNGELGAGKTTLTKSIGEGAGVQGNISSPTFLIARTHPTNSGTNFVHIDAYRLSEPRELDDLDIDYPNSISVIEWGRGFTDGLATSAPFHFGHRMGQRVYGWIGYLHRGDSNREILGIGRTQVNYLRPWKI